MISKKKRIDKTTFNEVFNNAKVSHSPLFIIRISRKKDDTDSLFSFVVSKKVEKTAVKRNKLRRIGYKIIKKYEDKIEKGFIFMFFFKKEEKTQEIENDILGFLKTNKFI